MKITRKAALVMAAVPAIVLITPVGSASAHGYVSSPPSRTAQCAQRMVPCGAPTWEPQSAEGPKGLMNCNGGREDFNELNDDSKGWKATSTGSSLTVTWTFTARHRTRDYEYYINGSRVAYVNGNNAAPADPVRHTINLAGFSGRQKIYAIWNIADTGAAFYSCIDVNVGGGTNPPPTTQPPTTQPPTTQPPTTQPPTTTPPTTQPPAGGTWATNTAYAAGAQVTYGGSTYRCRQAHTSLAGWEPPNAAALWEKI